jgi:hypothetical protein
MRLTRRGKIVGIVWLVVVLGWAGAAPGQAAKSFIGKITEIAKATSLGIGKHDTFYTVRLDEYPTTGFRISFEDAVRFGVIDVAGPSAVVTPKQSKGLGWKVKLTCDGNNLGLVKAPIYKVNSLERLSD